MNLAPYPMPGLKFLHRHDRIIRGAMNKMVFGVVVAAGMLWMSQPAQAAQPPAELMLEAGAIQWVAVGGLVMSAVAALVLVWRYSRVKKILTCGITVKGIVEDLEAVSFRTDSESSTSTPSYRHVHFATIRYMVQGVEQQVCLKLPNSGFTYGLVKSREVDLIVLETAPRKPLIRAVYTNVAQPMPP